MSRVGPIAGDDATTAPCVDAPMLKHGVWIDLVDPDAAERAHVTELTGMPVPSRAALAEVESSSRLRRSRAGLLLSTPMIVTEDGGYTLQPLGFMLSQHHIVSVRFGALRALSAVEARLAEDDGDRSSRDVFIVILEELVDMLADVLEDLSGDLDRLSTRIFAFDTGERPGARRDEATAPKRRDLALRRLLRAIGRHRKALTKVRASLLGLERIAGYVGAELGDGLAGEQAPRLQTVARDIESLDEFETRLSETLQFLLDAALGLINIEQNSVFRILTVVSVVGVPPTLIASIYGMNFKAMPELDWTYGYPLALGLILTSAVVPLLFFRTRGWI